MALKLKPSEIRFSQDSIKSLFVNGSALGFNLDEICEGRLDASKFPMICVAKRDEKWFTMDNRRLWLFQELERLGKCGEIPVQEIPAIPGEKLTTTNDGISVIIRGTLGGSWVSKPDVPVSERRPATFFKIEPSRLTTRVIIRHNRSSRNRPSPYGPSPYRSRRRVQFDYFDESCDDDSDDNNSDDDNDFNNEDDDEDYY